MLLINHRFNKLLKTVPLKGQSAEEVAIGFFNAWGFIYEAPKNLIAENGKWFTSKFFQSVFQMIGVQKYFTARYHSQTKGQIERYRRNILFPLRTYVAENHRDWYLYTEAPKYA